MRMGFLRKLLQRRQAPTGDLDAMTLRYLAGAGADLGLARETIHYLYVPTRQAAERAALDLARDGRHIETRAAATGGNWLVLVKEHLVVSDESIEALRREFEAAANTLGGEYDGWEAAVEPDSN